MKIIDVKATPLLIETTEAGRSTTSQRHPMMGGCLVEVKTDDGLIGIGESDVPPSHAGEFFIGVKALIEKGFKSLLLGEDPTNYRSLWDKMHDYSWLCKSGIGMSALSGVDTALVDLVGKAMGVPAYKILGGCYRTKVRPYASHVHITPKNIKEGCKEAVNFIEKGFTAVKISFSSFPNFGQSLNEDIKYVKEIRDAIGYDVDLMISDRGPPRSVSKAISIAKKLEVYNPLFWEDPITRGDIDAYARLTASVDLPIETGEENNNQMLKQFILKRAVDCVNPDVAQIGGLSEMKKIADLTYTLGIRLYPHSFLSAISSIATIHLITSMPDGDLFEYRASYPDPLIEELLVEPLKIKNGYIEVSKRPGLGIELNREVVEKFTWKG
jgi:L-alanine-DL-glutamate epimerase-like enolase superfamily enzyme